MGEAFAASALSIAAIAVAMNLSIDDLRFIKMVGW
jgi:acyl dehydratase